MVAPDYVNVHSCRLRLPVVTYRSGWLVAGVGWRALLDLLLTRIFTRRNGAVAI